VDGNAVVGQCRLCAEEVKEEESYIPGRPGTSWEGQVTHMRCLNRAASQLR